MHLGGFHTLMSFVGSIGSFMDGSGLETVLQTIYGENTVKHMLHGKAIARATRGYILVEAALTIKLQQFLCDDEQEANQNSLLSNEDLKEIEDTCDKVSTNEISLDDVNCQAVEKLNKLMASLKEEMSAKSRIAKLWSNIWIMSP